MGVRLFMPVFGLVLLVSCVSLGIAQTTTGQKAPNDDPPLESMSARWTQETVDAGADAEYLTDQRRDRPS